MPWKRILSSQSLKHCGLRMVAGEESREEFFQGFPGFHEMLDPQHFKGGLRASGIEEKARERKPEYQKARRSKCRRQIEFFSKPNSWELNLPEFRVLALCCKSKRGFDDVLGTKIPSSGEENAPYSSWTQSNQSSSLSQNFSMTDLLTQSLTLSPWQRSRVPLSHSCLNFSK